MPEPILEFDDVTIRYGTSEGRLTAVSDFSAAVEPGQYMGLVGESGCGKSTIARAIMGGLPDNGDVTSGKIRYKGTEIQDYTEAELNEEIRWKEISWIPQGAMNSLDPLQRMSEQAIEIGAFHTSLSKDEILDRICSMFETVGLQPDRVYDYPHQLSGGMQQRVMIAFALFLEPSLVVADEPTTALDVILQDQIFKHLMEIKESADVSLVLITHDISLVFESCDTISVMHSGQLMESGSVLDVYENPVHPYTILFERAFPDYRYPDEELEVIEGAPPQTFGDVDYCTFIDRCPWATEECAMAAPRLRNVGTVSNHADGHDAKCFNIESVRAQEHKEVNK